MLTSTSCSALPPPLQNSSPDAPTGDVTSNADGDLQQRGHKRKNNGFDPDVLIGKAFRIQDKSTSGAKSITLCPKLLISRACLPLAYLDCNRNADGIAGAQLFAAQLPELEGLLRVNTSDAPVLIAQSSVPNTSLYAIERAAENLYALCKLGIWVTIEALAELNSVSSDTRVKRQRCHERINPQDDWWREAAVHTVAGEWQPDSSKTSAFRRVRLSLEAPRVEDVMPISCTSPTRLAVQPCQGATGELTEEGTVSPAQTPEGIFSTLRAQYQEALYISKASLAYFAKGPLSRARALLQSKGAPVSEAQLLTAHLRSSVMPLSTMDKKYKETVPSIANALPADVLSEDDVEAVVSEYQKKMRKGKKGKIGKTGLYPGEEADIARWWLSRDSLLSTSDTHDMSGDTANVAIIDLRARETQLQIILILETLALEASHPMGLEEEILNNKLTDVGYESQPKKRKHRKSQDLKVLLDLFIDRLCIWQSMKLDDGNQLQLDGRKSGVQTEGQCDVRNSDALKDFCVDVVLPFYGARLPETVRMLRQKLGGPKTPSPIRPSLAKAASLSHLGTKSSDAIPRTRVKKPQRTLERVLTDEKAASRRRAPTLSRSTTDSALPGLKREASDTSLSTIPLNRVALHKSKRYSQREVDLNAVSQAAEAKLKKKTIIEQELQGAIAALKRPNPRMAVKELVEAAEKRAAGSHARKPKNPVRNVFAQGVQVLATPKGNRQKDVFGGRSQLPQPSEVIPEPDEIPPSSAPRVPSSVQRSTFSRIQESQAGLPKISLHPTVEHTPTRGPAKYNHPLAPSVGYSSDTSQLCTPLNSRRSAGIFTPQQQDLRGQSGHDQSSSQLRPLDDADNRETPIKHPAKPSVENARACNRAPITSSPPAVENETSTSIYDTLGWNDDFDDLS